MARRQLIVDCETTSLEPDYETGSGVIWELAVIERERGTRHLWRMKPDLAAASPSALQVGRYYERTAEMSWHSFDKTSEREEAYYDLGFHGWRYWSQPRALAAQIAPFLHDATLLGANPAFDAGFLAAFLRHYGQAPAWHFRLRDIGSMAWAWLACRNTHQYASCTGRYPHPAMDASTDEFAEALGINLEGFERHTALGDCLLVGAMLDVIEGGDR